MYSNTNQGERVMPVLVVQGGGQEGHGGTQGRLSEYFITLLLTTTLLNDGSCFYINVP